MVTRNRLEGSGSPHWWNNLPAQVQNRFSQPLTHDPEPKPEPKSPTECAEVPAPLRRGELLSDLSRLAALFFLVACGNILFLLFALAVVCS